jgi:uncharacterized RDD family membrane protein YckC
MPNQNEPPQISVGLRLATMLLDHVCMTAVAFVFFIPGFISTVSAAFNPSHENPFPDVMQGVYGYIAMFGFALYFCKDIFAGRSIAKRILKLQVVNNSSGKAASPIRCFLRNITCVIWPIEGLIALSNTSRRLGDRIAGTKLVKFDPTIEQPGFNFFGFLLAICLSYGMVLALMQVLPDLHANRPIYSKTSYNPSESAALQKLLADSLGQDVVPDIRVYDTVRNADLKYISVILRLKENYLDDDHSFAILKAHMLGLIYTGFPQQTFIGELQCVYRAPGQIETRSSNIGAYPSPPKRN